jgi:hypothetical protein
MGDYRQFRKGSGNPTPTFYKNQNVIDHYRQIVFCPYNKTMILKKQLLQEIEQAPEIPLQFCLGLIVSHKPSVPSPS